MKPNKLITATLVGFALCSTSYAEAENREIVPGNPAQLSSAGRETTKMDGYFMEDGKVVFRKDNESSAVTSNMTLDDGSVVMPNGTVKTSEGNVIVLKNGDAVGMDGTIMKPDVLVHKDGKMFIRRDGKDEPMTETVVINDGTKVMVDGTYVTKDGTSRELGTDQQIDWAGRVKSADIVESGPPGKL